MALTCALVVVAGAGGSAAGSQGSHRATTATLGERAVFGAFVEGMQAKPGLLARVEKKIGAPVGIASYYYGFGDVFPAAPEQRFSRDGTRTVLVSWDMGSTRFAEWTSGQHDEYLDQIAQAALDYPHDVYVRPWPEMNGDWQSFQPTADGARPHGGTYEEFKRAWRYVVTYLRSAGATNLRWVFNPTADTYAETTPVERIWPGAEYVDVLGLDGFNWGIDKAWGRWLSFDQIFSRQYRRLAALHPTAPVWLCEVASKEPRRHDGAPKDPKHRKDAWVRTMLADTSMPRISAVIWFHSKKERDWRLTSSSGVVDALRPLFRRSGVRHRIPSSL